MRLQRCRRGVVNTASVQRRTRGVQEAVAADIDRVGRIKVAIVGPRLQRHAVTAIITTRRQPVHARVEREHLAARKLLRSKETTPGAGQA